jgi:putative flippase GtrA
MSGLLKIFSASKKKLGLFLRYGIGGLIGAFVNLAVLFVWVTVLGQEETYLAGLFVGFLLALISTFALQKYWAFKDVSAENLSRQFGLYTLVACSGLLLNAVLLMGAKALFESFSSAFFEGWYLLVQAIAIVIVALSNFCLNYLFTFHRSRDNRTFE